MRVRHLDIGHIFVQGTHFCPNSNSPMQPSYGMEQFQHGFIWTFIDSIQRTANQLIALMKFLIDVHFMILFLQEMVNLSCMSNRTMDCFHIPTFSFPIQIYARSRVLHSRSTSSACGGIKFRVSKVCLSLFLL